MGDDGCSASELRRRYHMGGDLKDDTLTAPQLRARYGIKKNKAGVYHEWYGCAALVRSKSCIVARVYPCLKRRFVKRSCCTMYNRVDEEGGTRRNVYDHEQHRDVFMFSL